MPYKVWAVNEILTAADMNTYVGNQTILSFAGTAARASSIGTPVEGMLSYVGSGVVEVYAGTATGWAEISGGGGVTVGTAAPAGPAEGDLWLNSTEAKMYVYYDDGTSAQWVAAVGGTVPQQGKILQVVEGSTTTLVTTTSGTYADTTLSAAITPSDASSKVLILVSQQATAEGTGTANGLVRIMRDATEVAEFIRAVTHSGSGVFVGGNFHLSYLDSPATTSAITYKTQIATTALTVRAQKDSSRSNMILMEVAG